MDSLRKKTLEKQGYRIVGNHSVIKICLWCKKSLKDEDVCYKNTFYGLNSHRCVQMSPVIDTCSLSCEWCWRDVDKSDKLTKIDSPKKIIDGCIEAQKEILQGFLGNKKTNLKHFKEAMEPKHFAISLTGESTFYKKLPELIKELKNRKLSSFLVTNGTNPNMLKKLIKNQPTQLYMTLPAPNEKVFKKVCKPKIKNAWKNILESLSLLNKFKRNVIRLTLVKRINMLDPEGYSKLIKKSNPMFIEVKAGMATGYARYRMEYNQMPLHSEIVDFSKQIAKFTNYKIVDEKKESRVVLLMKEDKNRKIKFQ